MRKNVIIVLLSVVLGSTMLAGCGNNEQETVKESQKQEQKQEQPQETKKEDEKKSEDVIVQPKENKELVLKFGKLLDSTINGDVLIVKAKIEPSYNNKTTISQNGFNIEDLILNQGAEKYNEIQYWAVADMQNGSEDKVISFTVNKGLIDSIKNKNIVGNQIVDNANDVWILPSLTQ